MRAGLLDKIELLKGRYPEKLRKKLIPVIYVCLPMPELVEEAARAPSFRNGPSATLTTSIKPAVQFARAAHTSTGMLTQLLDAWLQTAPCLGMFQE
jgi:hypothetical protein